MTDSVRQDADLRDLEFDYGHQAVDGPVRRYHHADVTLAEVMRAVPAQSRRARDQVQALRCALACPDLEGLQARFRAKLEQFIRVHVLHASWGGDGRAPRGVSSPGRDRVCALVRDPRTGKPISHTTYKRLRRWWEQRGYLAIVREGWTPDLSPAILREREPGRDHNMTQAYVLCTPRRAETRAMRQRRRLVQTKNGPLSVFSKTDSSLARAREKTGKNHSAASRCYPAAGRPAGKPERQRRPKGSPEGAVRLHVGALARVSDGWWAHLTRPFARWEPRDLLYAIDHHPDGSAHTGTAEQVRNPAGWLRWRLSHWLNPDGTARLSPAEEADSRARRHRERQALEHAELGITARSARIRAASPARPAAPEPQRSPAPRPDAGTGAAAAAAARPGLASLALELHQLKQEGRLDDQARAAALSRALQARHAAPCAPQDAPGAETTAEPPPGAAAPAYGTAGGRLRPDPEWEAAVAAAAANVAREAARPAGETRARD